MPFLGGACHRRRQRGALCVQLPAWACVGSRARHLLIFSWLDASHGARRLTQCWERGVLTRPQTQYIVVSYRMFSSVRVGWCWRGGNGGVGFAVFRERGAGVHVGGRAVLLA